MTVQTAIAAAPPIGGAEPARADAAVLRQTRSPLAGMVEAVCALLDRLIAASSLVPVDPVLDVRLFPWTQALRENWRAIRAEAEAVAVAGSNAPWRCCVLWDYGDRIEANAVRCPVTAGLVAQVPGLSSAFFSILAPGAHVPEHRGPTKGLITCQLGLIVPRDGDARMRVRDRVVRWAEGETLVFDNSYRHEVWNDSHGLRVVLIVQAERPMRRPGRWIAGAVLSLLRRSRPWQVATKQLNA